MAHDVRIYIFRILKIVIDITRYIQSVHISNMYYYLIHLSEHSITRKSHQIQNKSTRYLPRRKIELVEKRATTREKKRKIFSRSCIRRVVDDVAQMTTQETEDTSNSCVHNADAWRFSSETFLFSVVCACASPYQNIFLSFSHSRLARLHIQFSQKCILF